MKNFTAIYIFFLVIFLANSAAFADVKIKQRVTVEGQGMEQTRMIKGARERRETKMVMSGAGESAADIMPNIATITQCDLRRTLQVNDKKKLYFANAFGDGETSVSPQTSAVVTKTRKGGVVTITYIVTDTLERKQLFGMTARHLKVLQMIESSADSCSGAQKTKMETDGWYADFSADFNCPIDVPDTPERRSKPDCLDRIVYKRSGTTRLGFLLDGTMKSFDENGNVTATIRTETLEMSRASLSSTLFDVGQDYKLVASAQDLYAMPSMTEMTAMANQETLSNSDVSGAKPAGKKYLGLDFFTGDSSKINQDTIRQSMMESLNSKGFATSFVTSPNEITNGRFDFVIGVEIKQIKQSKAAKIGGLFGKVTGTSDAKVGDSEADVIVTLYQKDGKTIVAAQNSKQKVAGSPDDAAKAAIENALSQIAEKIN